MNVFFKMLSVLIVFSVIGCGGSKDSPPKNTVDDTEDVVDTDNTTSDTETATEITIDATAGGLGAPKSNPLNKHTYFSFESGAVVELTDDEAATSNAWDIAFKRSAIKLNGGISGSKGVTGYYVKNNTEAYNAEGDAVVSWFDTATKETELEDLNSITEADIPADSEFTADSLVKAIKGDGSTDGWWLYDPATHLVSANATKYWVIKTSEGTSYAKVKIDSLTKTASFREIAVSFSLQATGESVFSNTTFQHTFNVPLGSGYLYYDFDSQTEVSSDNNNWDIKIGYEAMNYNIFLNGGVSGTGSAAAFGPFESSDEFLSGSVVPFFTSDSSGGLFVTSSWYAYSLANDNKLYPNYRVYIINSGTNSYKLQILSYYHPETTESAYITIRFEKIK